MNNLKALLNVPNIILLLIVIISLFSQMLPLVQILNFEFSFLFSILLFIASGVLTIYYLRKFKTFGVLPAIIMMKYKNYLLLLFAPLLISVFSNLLFQMCPIWNGIFYYIIIVIPAFYFGFVAGAFSFWSNKKSANLIFGGIFILFAFAPVLEFYIYPQVYFYNIIVGIIPGTIYDEEILISGKLIFYRILQIFITSLILYSIYKIGSINKKSRKLLMLSTLLGAVLFFLLKPYLGYATTKYKLFQNLKMIALTHDVEIRYTDNLMYNEANHLTFETIYYMNEIEEKTKLSTPKDLIVYIFKNREQKGALFGSKAANVAKPWMNQIFIDYQSVENTLEHELTHIYAAQIGSTPFKIADGFNMAMLEGYAMAIEDNYSGYDIHYMASLAKESGYNFNILELFSRFNFFGQASSLSYITAGSFVKFLIENYGIETVNSLYQDLDFEKYLSKNINELEDEYKQFLESLSFKINKDRANLFFGRKPITKKVCPRTVAAEIKSAWELFGEGSYISAKSEFRKIYNYSNSYSAFLGLIYSNNKLNLYSESLVLFEKNINSYQKTSSYYSALLNYGDVLSFNKKYEKADSVYELLSNLKPTIRYKNLAEIRRKLISENKISDYLNGSDFDKYVILQKLNKNEIFDSSIPIMIELSEKLNQDIRSFAENFDMKNNKNISSNTAYQLSKYFLRNWEINNALKFANISVNKCEDNFRLPILNSNLEKIKWFSKFSN